MRSASEILDELDYIESRLLVLDKQLHSDLLAAHASKESDALKRKQAELLAELRRLEPTAACEEDEP